MKKTNLLFTLFFIMTMSICSCTSNDSEDSTSNKNPYSKLILGKWAWTTLSAIDQCVSYREFKSNGTLTYYQNVCGSPEIDNFTYIIDDNKLFLTSMRNDGGTNTETIISITDTTMKTSFSVGSALPIQYRTYIKIK